MDLISSACQSTAKNCNHMKHSFIRHRYRTVSSRTPREELDLKMTGEGESMDVNGSCDDGILPKCRYSKQTCRGSSRKRMKLKKQRKTSTIKVGTWNVQTMMEMGKLDLLLIELERSQMNITGLCEVRWSGEGKFKIGDFFMFIAEMRKVVLKELQLF